MDALDEELMRIPHLKEREIINCNILRVVAGTTGYCLGDWGHGGRTYFAIEDEASTGWMVRVIDQNGRKYLIEWPKRVEILLGGDAELETIIQALRWIARVLAKQTKQYALSNKLFHQIAKEASKAEVKTCG